MAYWLNQLTWTQAERQIEKVPVALVPVGATEQHGPHLPTGPVQMYFWRKSWRLWRRKRQAPWYIPV